MIDSFWVLSGAIFVATFILDVCWASYVTKVKMGNALGASLWAVLLYCMGAIGTVGYVVNHWLLVPAAIGAFAGTYVGVSIQKHNRKG